MSTPELVYEIWHLDDGIPTRLTTREESTDAARVLRREPRSVIVRQGVVIQQRADVTPGQAKLLRDAAAKAWADAGGTPPEPPPTPDANAKPSKFRGGTPPPAFGRRARPKEQPLSVPSPSEEAPVARRKPATKPVEEVPAMSTNCPCGAPSAPTAQHGGRPSTPEFADLCKVHRQRALARRAKGIAVAAARVAALATSDAPGPTKRAKAKPARVAAAKTATKAKRVAPTVDLLDVLRRQRAVVDALGGLDAAEAHVAMVEHVGPEQLAAIVEELGR